MPGSTPARPPAASSSSRRSATPRRARYLGAEPGFDATYHVRLGDVGHTWEVRCTAHGARVRKGVTEPQARRDHRHRRRRPGCGCARATLSGVEAFSPAPALRARQPRPGRRLRGPVPPAQRPRRRCCASTTCRVRPPAHLDADDGRGPRRRCSSTAWAATKASFFDTAAALSRATTASTRSTCPASAAPRKPATRAATTRAGSPRRSRRRWTRWRSSGPTWSATRWAAGWRSRSACASPSASSGARPAVSRRRLRASATATRSCASLRPELGLAPPPLRAAARSRSQFWAHVRRPRPDRPERRRRRRRRVPAHLRLAGRAASPSSRSARNIYLDAPVRPQRLLPAPRRPRAAGAVRLGLARPADPRRPSAPRRASGCPAPSRSCWTAAATSRRSSGPSRPTACCARFFARRRRARRPRRAAALGAGPRARRPPRRAATATARPSAAPATAATPRRAGARQPSDAACAARSSARIAGAGQQRASRPPTSTSATPTTSARACRACGCWRACTSAARSAGWATSPRTGRCCWSATTRAATSRPTRPSSRSPSAPTSASSGAFYQLAHNLVLSMPGLSLPAQVRHGRRLAGERRKALRSGAALLVYPGGDYEVHRPSWERNQVDFDGRKGFIRLALDAGRADRPGGRRSAARRRRCSSRAASGSPSCSRLDQLFRLKVLPISLALPWGLNVGDMLGHIPLPAKITVEALPPIHLREEFGAEPDLDEVYDHVTAADAGDARRAGRRAAAAGARMRVAESIEVAAPPEVVWEVLADPDALPALHVRHHALGGRRRRAARAWARATGCSCGSARPRSAA